MRSLATTLKESYLAERPIDAARLIEKVPQRELIGLFDGIQPIALARCLDYLSGGRAVAVFQSLDAGQQGGVLSAAPPRLAVALLDALPDDERDALLATLPASDRKDLVRLRSFDEGTAGRLLDRPYDTIRTGMTVAEALEVLRRSGAKRTRSVYVVDSSNKLVGKVDMQSMAVADAETTLDALLEPLEGSVTVTSPRKEIVEQLERFRVDSLPVTDVEGRLLGVVRYQRLFEAIESVATADIQKMVGASVDERALSGAMFSVRKRLPWLHINLLTAFLAAAVVGFFESLIAQFTALAVLLPVVAGQSGNAGSQALAVTMRGLALREIGTRDWRSVLSKEVRVGLVDGLALAVTCGAAVWVWSQSPGLALVIAVAMVISMVAAGISGALVPITLIRIGQDPATASSIILTTVTDVAGFISFLGTATLLSFML
jgi:magnesium transporter